MFKNEKIVEIKSCKHCKAKFEITDKDLEFYEKVSPVFEGKKYLIPSPKLCPDCRQQRRLSFRNERKLYKRKCDFTGKDIVSIYSPDKPYKVYNQATWWSDKWDSLDYGIDFDFKKSFFEQFNELMIKVPKISIMNDEGFGSENCEYCQDFSFGKNCYFSTATWYSENEYYCDQCLHGKDLVDCDLVNNNSSNCYESIVCDNIKNCSYVQVCINCFECHQCFDLIGCDFCYGCNGLRNKKYYFFNKSLSKSDYENELKKIKKSNKLEEFKKGKPLPASIMRNSLNCVGDNIINSKNVFYGFDISDVENSKFVFRLNSGAKDCYDIHQSGSTVLVYEGLTPDKTYHGAFISWCWEDCRDIYYCDNCHTSTNLFGCVGLKNKSYCIFNKQYTKEEYEKLVPKIIEHMMSFPSPFGRGARGEGGEWGEFFPSSISPFGYNETIANEYFPLNKNEILKFGFIYSDYENPFPKVEKIIPASSLPDDISKIPDDILNWAIECEKTGKPFRIIKQELEFYRKHNLPIPRRHPDQRYLDRMKIRNPSKLFERICNKCGTNIKTTYSPDRKEIIYCEECYEKEVY